MKVISLFVLLWFGQIGFAQPIKIRPSLSLSFPFNRFVSSTIPEPLFSTTFTRSGDPGLLIEMGLNDFDYLYLKLASFSVSNSMRAANDAKSEFMDLFFGQSTLTTTDQLIRLGLGMKKDLLFNSKRGVVFGLYGINLDIQGDADTIGSISGPYSPLLVIEDWKTTNYNKVISSFEIGLGHTMVNRKKKEILEVLLSFSRSFKLVSEKTLFFRYTGPRFGGSQQQKAIFKSYGQAFQLTVSKAINLNKQK